MKEQWFKNLKYLFLTFATLVVLYGLVSQIGLSVQAAQLPANPGSQLPANPGSTNPGSQLPANPAPAAPAPAAPAPAAPAPVITVNPASNLNGSCPDGQRAFFSWSPASKTGQSVQNYTLRLNKEPFGDWMGPGDHAFQVGNTTSYNDALPAGRYGFSIQAGFSDGSTSNQVNGPEFECAAQSAPAPLRLGCNDACTSNSQCNNDDANRACIGGFCRLSTNPSSVTCSPPSQAAAPTATPTPTPVPQGAAAAPTATPTPTPVPGAPTPTPTPVPSGATAFACPANGGTFMVNGSVINCQAQAQQQTQNNNQTVTINNPAAPVAAAPAPVKVAGVSNVKELPKTGLPLVAWAISGLLPLGIGLKRFSGSEGEEDGKTASYIWQKREYLRG